MKCMVKKYVVFQQHISFATLPTQNSQLKQICQWSTSKNKNKKDSYSYMQKCQGNKDTLKKLTCEPIFIQDNFILQLNKNKLVHGDNIYKDVANLKIKYRDFMIGSQLEKFATICRLSYFSRTFLSRKSMLVYSRKEQLTMISFQSIFRGGFFFFLLLVTVAYVLST